MYYLIYHDPRLESLVGVGDWNFSGFNYMGDYSGRPKKCMEDVMSYARRQYVRLSYLVVSRSQLDQYGLKEDEE
jgi:hypothetical protein